MEKSVNLEAKLYYLYMASDGEVSQKEVEIFDIICDSLKISSTEKILIKDSAERLLFAGESLTLIKRNIINNNGEALKKYAYRIIWNLVNLGNADSFYTREEEEIVKYLCKEWEIKEEIYLEFVDVANTMLALEKKKEWVCSRFYGVSKINKINEIEREMNILQKDVKMIISLAER